ELANAGLFGLPGELCDLVRRPATVERDANLHGATTPLGQAARAPRLAEMAPDEVVRAASRQDGARLVIARPLVAVEPVPRRVEVHRKGRVRRTDLRVVLRRSEEHTSELQSRGHLVCRLLLEKKKKTP